ncbi:MAG TPA: nucleotidyltransferase [Desulfobacteraceae bacterium]|nr:nucleotidyltransferase [Desulfobacteraceae bacterium]
MGRKEIIKILQDYKKEVAETYPILKIGVFGSAARGDSGSQSDVDIVIRISEPDFFMLSGIKTDLEKRLNASVDIVTYRDTMNSFLKQRIDEEAVYA